MMKNRWKYVLALIMLICLFTGGVCESRMIISACGAELPETASEESITEIGEGEEEMEESETEESESETEESETEESESETEESETEESESETEESETEESEEEMEESETEESEEETEESETEESEEETEESETVESETEDIMEPLEVKLEFETGTPKMGRYYNEHVILAAGITGGSGPLNRIQWHVCYTKAETGEILEVMGNYDEMESFLETHGLGKTEKIVNKDMETGQRLILMAEGSYVVQLSVWDSKENLAKSQESSFIIDRTAPSLSLTEISEAMAGNGIYGIRDIPVISVTAKEQFMENAVAGLDGINYFIIDSSGNRKNGILQNSSDEEMVLKWQGHIELYPTDFFDGRLEIVVQVTDRAGNINISEPVILMTDTHIPDVSFSFDTSDQQSEKYYAGEKILRITVKDDNFDLSCLPEIITDNQNGYTFAGWQQDGEMTEGMIVFSGDGEYEMSFSCMDLAGNHSDVKALPSFIIDRTAPELIIDGVENCSSNSGKVAPGIRLYDENVSGGGIGLSLVEASSGTVNIQSLIHIVKNEHGESILFDNFGPEMDGIYTLRAEAEDLAGNKALQEIRFTVNRKGSSFRFSNGTEQLFEQVFIRRPKDIVIYEDNLDWLTLQEVSLSCNGEMTELTEGQDYRIDISGGEESRKQYVYTVFAESFKTEGTYAIHIYSEDEAANVSSNDALNRKLGFILDSTAPQITVINLEDRQYYHEKEHEFTVIITDNTLLESVRYYLDDELMAAYDREELEQAGGVLNLKTGSSDDYQTIRLEAADAAGNQAEPMEWHVLVNATRQTLGENRRNVNNNAAENTSDIIIGAGYGISTAVLAMTALGAGSVIAICGAIRYFMNNRKRRR